MSQELQGITLEIKVSRELGFKFYFKVLNCRLMLPSICESQFTVDSP